MPTEIGHIDPHDADVDALVQRVAETLRDAPEGSHLTLDRDTARALVGAYRLAVSALDDLADAVRECHEIEDTGLLAGILADRGIEIDGVSDDD